jgi:mRNA-degrading endonuclease RelE of RelBE toxin-antitoxin system
MSFEIQTTNYFDAEAKRLAKRHSSFVDDLQDLRDNLLKNPYQGTELSPGIRKVRLTISSKGRGKSGGARVITFTYLVNERLTSKCLCSACRIFKEKNKKNTCQEHKSFQTFVAV